MSGRGTPRYQQLKDEIVARIADGELKPGDRVPSENDLVVSGNVSRMTANRALRELTDEGYVKRVAGRGTFVADFRARSHVLEVHDIAVEIEARGHAHASRVLRSSEQRARGEVAKALAVEQGTAVCHLMLVHYENAVPVQLEDRHVLLSFAPECAAQDFGAQTPSAYLSSIAPMSEAEQAVRAAMPNRAVREHLAMDQGEPSLVILRRTWSGGRPVTFARLNHPASRYELTGHYTPPGSKRSAPAAVPELETLKQ